MGFETIHFPSFGDKTVFISLLTDVPQSVLQTVKSKLIEGNKDYDFCFLNCNYIISREHLLSGIYKALNNWKTELAKAKTLNTEIIFNMSPVNNIMEALKRFGVDSTNEKDSVLCIKVTDEKTDFEQINHHLLSILEADSSQNVPLTDEYLYSVVDQAKFKKLYKLNDAKITNQNVQAQLTRLAIGACLLRGN